MIPMMIRQFNVLYYTKDYDCKEINFTFAVRYFHSCSSYREFHGVFIRQLNVFHTTYGKLSVVSYKCPVIL